MSESIIQQYFDTEKTNPLKQCIYEEKETGDDREWFFFNDNWCYFELKQERDKDFEDCEDKSKKIYKNVYKLVSKRHKTFKKTCSIIDLSFGYYFILQYFDYYKCESIDETELESLKDKYYKHKNETNSPNIIDFFKAHDEQKQQLQKQINENVGKGCAGCFLVLLIFLSLTYKFLWIITLPLFIGAIIEHRKTKKQP